MWIWLRFSRWMTLFQRQCHPVCVGQKVAVHILKERSGFVCTNHAPWFRSCGNGVAMNRSGWHPDQGHCKNLAKDYIRGSIFPRFSTVVQHIRGARLRNLNLGSELLQFKRLSIVTIPYNHAHLPYRPHRVLHHIGNRIRKSFSGCIHLTARTRMVWFTS